MFSQSDDLDTVAVGASKTPLQHSSPARPSTREMSSQNMVSRDREADEARKPNEGEKKQVWRLTREFGAENNN